MSMDLQKIDCRMSRVCNCQSKKQILNNGQRYYIIVINIIYSIGISMLARLIPPYIQALYKYHTISN